MAQVAQVRGLNGKGNCLRNTAGSRTEQNAGIPARAGHEESEEEKTQRKTAGNRTETAEYRRMQDRTAGIPARTGQKEKRMAEKEQNNKNGHTYRATWKDYSEPTIYLLTMNTEDRQPLLGELVGEKIVLSAYGKVVSEEIKRIPTYKDASAIQIYRYVVMPNHIHVLLRVHKKLPHPLGYYISWFKLQCMERAAGIPAGTGHEESGEGDTLRNTAGDRTENGAAGTSLRNTAGNRPPKRPIFGKEYHDRILMHKGQLAHMARYIQDNPRRLAMKRANPDLFRIRQNIRFGRTPCVALGNIFLAEYPQREVLQCSRRLTQAEIDAKREECLKEAANGTVYVSGAISEGEKQISRALREAGYPLIILLTEGFPEPDSPHYQFFKPQGVYFEACAAGKLLLIQPDKEVLELPDIEEKVTAKVGNIPHESQRYRFVAMNAIAEEIARD